MFLLGKCMSRKVSSRLETPSGYLRYRLRNEFLSQVDFNRDFLLSKRMQWFSISLENSTRWVLLLIRRCKRGLFCFSSFCFRAALENMLNFLFLSELQKPLSKQHLFEPSMTSKCIVLKHATANFSHVRRSSLKIVESTSFTCHTFLP